jgi:HEAT repeat protein
MDRVLVACLTGLAFFTSAPVLRGAEPKPELVIDGKSWSAWVEQLRGQDEKQRRRAGEALTALAAQAQPAVSAAVERILDEAATNPGGTAQALYSLRGLAVPGLTQALWDESRARRFVAIYTLGHLGSLARPAVPSLMRALADEEAPIRARAAEALGGIKAHSAAAALTRLLQDKEQSVRTAAALALVELGGTGENLVPVVLTWLKSAERDQRLTALEVLTLLRREAVPALPALLKMLDDDDRQIRRSAFVCLQQIGPPGRAAGPALAAILKDVNRSEDHLAAGRALWVIARSPEVVPFLQAFIKVKGPERAEAAELLGRVGKSADAVPVLLEELRQAKKAQRVALVERLARLGPGAKAALPALVDALQEQDPRLRTAALHALARLGELDDAAEPAVAELTKLAKSADVVERFNARRALVRIRKNVAHLNLLADLLKEDPAELRGSAADLLGQFGPDAKAAVPALRELLKDADAHVRSTAAMALWKINRDDAVLPALMALLQDRGFEARTAAVYSLGVDLQAAAQPAIPLLVKALWDAAPEVRVAAPEALGRIGPAARPAVPALLVLLGDDQQEDVHSAVAEALGLIGPPARAAVLVLQRRLEHADAYVRACAALALWHIDKDRSGIQAASAGLDHRNYRVRVTAAEALWRMRQDPRAMTALVEVFREAEIDDHPAMENARYMACRAVGRLGPPAKAAAPFLRELLTSDNPDLRATAAQALKTLEDR